MRYLQKTMKCMWVCKNVDDLNIVGYSDFDFASCPDDEKSTFGYIFYVGWRSYILKECEKNYGSFFHYAD